MKTTKRPKHYKTDVILLADAIRGLMKLLDDGDLVRNTNINGDFEALIQQTTRVTNALHAAHKALSE